MPGSLMTVEQFRAEQKRKQACLGKIPHPDYHKANEAAVKLTKRGGGTCRPYFCRYCKSWHAGHSRRRKKVGGGHHTVIHS